MNDDSNLPQSSRATKIAAGHWVLARAGKRVLRPGGLKLTNRMLQAADIPGKRVVEFAPGLGKTAKIIIDAPVESYTGVDQDPDAAQRVRNIVADSGGRVVQADAQDTGLESQSAQVVVGEAMLTMQSEKNKEKIVSEAYRILEPGGCYVIHELGLTPNDIDMQLADQLRKRLAQAIRVNARPLTENEWRKVLENAGFVIEWVGFEPMALLSPRRNLADEGVKGVLRILGNVLRDRELRSRILEMRATFKHYRKNLTGIAIIARKPGNGNEGQR